MLFHLNPRIVVGQGKQNARDCDLRWPTQFDYGSVAGEGKRNASDWMRNATNRMIARPPEPRTCSTKENCEELFLFHVAIASCTPPHGAA